MDYFNRIFVSMHRIILILFSMHFLCFAEAVPAVPVIDVSPEMSFKDFLQVTTKEIIATSSAEFLVRYEKKGEFLLKINQRWEGAFSADERPKSIYEYKNLKILNIGIKNKSISFDGKTYEWSQLDAFAKTVENRFRDEKIAFGLSMYANMRMADMWPWLIYFFKKSESNVCFLRLYE